MFAPATHSLIGREQFFTRTPANVHCGRFVLMNRENSRSGSSRPCSLTYAQLGVISSPEEKITQREMRQNKRKIPVLRVLCVNLYTVQAHDFVCICRGFSLAGPPFFDFIIYSFYVCVAFNTLILKATILHFFLFFSSEITEK